jgi:hypothetical protein
LPSIANGFFKASNKKIYLFFLSVFRLYYYILLKKDEVTGKWRKFHNGEKENEKENELGGDVARMGEGRNVYRVLVEKPEGKRRLGRPRRRWKDGIKMNLREIGLGVWSGFTWLRIGTVGGLL